MTSQVSCSDTDKERFEDLKESGETQADCFSRVLDQAEAFNGDLIDSEEVAELTADKIGTKIEHSMYRVINEMTGKVTVTANENGVTGEMIDALNKKMEERVKEERVRDQ